MSGFSQAPFSNLPYGMASSAPFVGNWAPFIGAYTPRLQLIEFDVTGDTPVYDTVVRVLYSSGMQETIYTDANGFEPPYRRASGRKAIANGYRYYVRRTNGWVSSGLQIIVSAADLAAPVTSMQSQ